MRSIWLPLSLLAGLGAIALVAVWLAGFRIFVVQPIGALPDGVTAIVSGAPGLRLIDSPDALCMRRQGSVTLLCHAAAGAAVAETATIHARLPYSETLYRWSGAPETLR